MFWDKVAGVYDGFIKLMNRNACARLQDEVASLLSPGDRVLECACGTGLLTVAMAPRCASLTATDYAPKMLERAAAKCRAYPHVTFQPGNILGIAFPDNTFDVVVAANVIHLLDDPYRALRELRRVCRPGGMLVIPTYINQTAEGKQTHPARLLEKLGIGFKRIFTEESYHRFFDEAGYAASFRLVDGRMPCCIAVIRKA